MSHFVCLASVARYLPLINWRLDADVLRSLCFYFTFQKIFKSNIFWNILLHKMSWPYIVISVAYTSDVRSINGRELKFMEVGWPPEAQWSYQFSWTPENWFKKCNSRGREWTGPWYPPIHRNLIPEPWSVFSATCISSKSSYPISLRTILILSSHLCLGLPGIFFHSDSLSL
jgi:hypothetical protein